MPVPEGKLYGRERFVQCVREALDHRGGSAQPLPIVPVEGPRGSGGTALVEELWRTFNHSALSVQLDLDSAQGVDDIVFGAMQGLRRKVRWTAPVNFARLRLAFKALVYTDDGGGRAAFDAHLRSKRLGAAIDALDRWSAHAAALLPALEPKAILALLTEAVRQVFSGLDRAHDAAALGWFARSSPFAGPGTGQDALWSLHRAYHDGDDTDKRDADKTLCAALLADLTAGYGRTILRGKPVHNCLLVADNVDNRAAAEFLGLIEECRMATVAKGEPADPLLVVVMRRRQAVPVAGKPIDCTDEQLDIAGANSWWYPVRLTDLSRDNVVSLLSPAPIRLLGTLRHDADFVHALTGGHPASTHLIARILAEPAPQERLRPHGLLEATPHQSDGGPRNPRAAAEKIEHRLLRRLAPDLVDAGPPDAADGVSLLDAMAACAVGEDMKLAACAAVFAFMRWPLKAMDVRLEFETRLWLREGADGAELPHPLIALLLRRRLADNAELWREVHQGYVTHYATTDAALRQRHRLAMVEPARTQDLPSIVKYLESELDQSSTPEWLGLLDRVSTAPNRIRSTRDPRLVVSSLAGHAQSSQRNRVITRLTVAKWLGHDRAFDPGHQLAQLIADEYDNLAQLPGPDADLFYERSAQHRKIDREWAGSC